MKGNDHVNTPRSMVYSLKTSTFSISSARSAERPLLEGGSETIKPFGTVNELVACFAEPHLGPPSPARFQPCSAIPPPLWAAEDF
jgi:hypothetical protein